MAGTRAHGFLAEIAEIERQDKIAAEKKLYEAAAPERAQVARDLAAAKRDLRKRLLMDANESADFQYTKYDGRFDTASPGVVTKAIQDAWTTFTAEHPELTKTELHGVTMFLGLFGTSPDLAKPEVFEQALTYLDARLSALDPQEVPAPSEIVEDPSTESVTSLNPFKMGSREYEAFEKQQYQRDLLTETLLSPLFSDTTQEIVDSTGKKIAGPHLIQFRKWLDEPAQKRRFSPLTRGEIRFAFCEFFSTEEFLTDSERSELDRRRTVDGMTSDQVAAITGRRGSYAPLPHMGIRQGGQE